MYIFKSSRREINMKGVRDCTSSVVKCMYSVTHALTHKQGETDSVSGWWLWMAYQHSVEVDCSKTELVPTNSSIPITQQWAGEIWCLVIMVGLMTWVTHTYSTHYTRTGAAAVFHAWAQHFSSLAILIKRSLHIKPIQSFRGITYMTWSNSSSAAVDGLR